MSTWSILTFLIAFINYSCSQTHFVCYTIRKLMLHTEIITASSKNRIEKRNTPCTLDVEFLHVKTFGMYINHYALKS